MDGYSSKNPESLKVFVYRFFQKVFTEPDQEFLNFILKRSTDLGEMGIEIDESLDLEILQTEYTRLFIGPEGHLPPYESVFLEGRFWGNSADEVKAFLRESGLGLREDFNMPPDHIAVEFEILEKILLSRDSNSEFLYARFLKVHILWIFDFLTKAILKTDLEFYKTAFAFAKVFLKGESQLLTGESLSSTIKE